MDEAGYDKENVFPDEDKDKKDKDDKDDGKKDRRRRLRKYKLVNPME